MITAYHRPKSLEEAMALMARSTPRTVPLGGGTLLSHGGTDRLEVVDLQNLGLNQIRRTGNTLEIGATVTLQSLLEAQQASPAFRRALLLEAPLNLRNAATIAGTLVTCDGRSGLAALLLALDTKLTLMRPKADVVGLGDFLPIRERILQGALIINAQLPANAKVAFEAVSRTPADKPSVCVALAQRPSGRTRLAVGGYGVAPVLAMDGTEAVGIEAAARNALHEAGDPWGSAEYRMDVAATLTQRCLASFASQRSSAG